jgi:formate dehydrogenase subunit delta
MNTQHLVSMVNDISNFYVSQGTLQEAAAQVESHVARYWEKRMRHEIIDHLRSGGDGMSEVSIAAIRILAREGDAAPMIHAMDGGVGGDAG